MHTHAPRSGYHFAALIVSLLLLPPVAAQTAPLSGANPPAFTSRADTPPRKIVVASTLHHFTGELDQRFAKARQLLDQASAETARTQDGRGLDLMVFPEFAFTHPGRAAAERALGLNGRVTNELGALAREHRTWLVAPMVLREETAPDTYTNAAVLFNRDGAVAGIYRKVFPVADPDGVLEGGTTPGNTFPVFECDFGRLGILICWDMAYPGAWEAMARANAEIVALPSAWAATVYPSAAAMRHHFYVINSTPKNNVTLYDPIGAVATRITEPGVLVAEIDLAYAILNWSPGLKRGEKFSARFGSRVGYRYTLWEGAGIFWSNDPDTTIGAMMRELNLWELPEAIERSRQAQDAARPATPFPLRPGGN